MPSTNAGRSAAVCLYQRGADRQHACLSLTRIQQDTAAELAGLAGRPRLPIIRKQQVAAAEVRGRVYNVTLPARREATAGCRASSLPLPARRAATGGCKVFYVTLSARRAATAAQSCTGVPPRGLQPRGELRRPPSLPALPSARAQTPMRGPPGLEPTLPLGRPAARAVMARQTAPST